MDLNCTDLVLKLNRYAESNRSLCDLYSGQNKGHFVLACVSSVHPLKKLGVLIIADSSFHLSTRIRTRSLAGVAAQGGSHSGMQCQYLM